MRLSSLVGLLLAFCVISLPLVSCRSGGEPDVAIVIESISPTGIVGTPGDTVQFSADVTGIVGTAVYTWNFGGGGTADNVASPTPNVVLGGVDPYTGTLTVDDGTTNDTLPFVFEVVDVPVVQSVTPTGSAGLPLGVVQFSASILGSPTSFDWTFSGGVLPTTSSDEEPVVTLQDAGDYSGVLVATNGTGDSEAFPFSFTVDAPVAPSWTFVKVGTETAVGRDGLSMQAVDGRLILTYNMTQNVGGVFSNVIRFTEATVGIPSQSTDFQSHTVDGESGDYIPQLSGVQSLGVSAEGIPYLLYGSNPASPDNETRIAVGTATPTSAADWHISDLQAGRGTNSTGPAVLVMNEQILALIPDSGSIYAFLSSTLDPDGTSDWVGHLAGRNDPRVLEWPMAALIDGNIQFCAAEADLHLLGALSFFRSLDSIPTTESDWLRFVVDARDVGYRARSYVRGWNGTPAIAYGGSPSLLNAPMLYLATSAEPEAGADFEGATIGPEGLGVGDFGLAINSNRLALLYGNVSSRAFNLLRQTGVDASDPESWTLDEFGPLGQDFTRPAAIASIADRLVISFVDPSDGLLTLAISSNEF